jgi:hypothetical protein
MSASDWRFVDSECSRCCDHFGISIVKCGALVAERNCPPFNSRHFGRNIALRIRWEWQGMIFLLDHWQKVGLLA